MATAPSFGTSRAGVAAAALAVVVSDAETGARLGTKEEVRARVDVSLGTFNETLRLLQERGLVTVRPGPGGGVFVAEQSPMTRLGHALLGLNIDRHTVAEAVRIRNALDFLIVEDACRYATEPDLTAIAAALQRMADTVKADDGIAFLRANWNLHSKIAAAARSEILSSIYLSLLDLIEEHTISVVSAGPMSLSEFHEERLAVHTELVRAIEDGDVDLARAVLLRHNQGLQADTQPRSHSHNRR